MFTDKTRYLLKNLLKGFLWLTIIVAVFLILKDRVHPNNNDYINKIFANTYLVYTTFLLSEVAFGILPPELFFIWGLQNNSVNSYVFIIITLSVISYAAGVTGYLFGRYLSSTRIFRFVRLQYLKKYYRRLHTFGMYLIAVAALTPLPFSGICMLVGSVKYPAEKFLLFAALRFVRFMAYSWIIWKANIL